MGDRWVWTTFNAYQWDLDYTNPDVFVAMAEAMLTLAAAALPAPVDRGFWTFVGRSPLRRAA